MSFLCKCCCHYHWVLCVHTAALLPGALGCSPPSQAMTPPLQEVGEEKLPCPAWPSTWPPQCERRLVPAVTLSSRGEIWPFFQMCGKGEKAFFSFTKYWTYIPSPTNPKGPWEASGPLWEVFVEPLQGRGGQAVQTQTEQEQPACRQAEALLPGILTVPFQHVDTVSQRSHPMVLVQCSMSHRPHQGFPSHPEEHAALQGQRRSRSWPGTASWTPGFARYHTSQPQTPFISAFLHKFDPVHNWGRQSRLGQKVKDAKETSTPPIPVKIFWLVQIRCTFIFLWVLSL